MKRILLLACILIAGVLFTGCEEFDVMVEELTGSGGMFIIRVPPDMIPVLVQATELIQAAIVEVRAPALPDTPRYAALSGKRSYIEEKMTEFRWPSLAKAIPSQPDGMRRALFSSTQSLMNRVRK